MNTETNDRNVKEYVTAFIGEELFGFPIRSVQDVFLPERIARVPLAPSEIAGVLNLRGRIVTLIDMRRHLGFPERIAKSPFMALGVTAGDESYGLLIDRVGEVLKLDDDAFESNPINLDPRLARVSLGVYRLERRLLIVIDVDRVLGVATTMAA